MQQLIAMRISIRTQQTMVSTRAENIVLLGNEVMQTSFSSLYVVMET